MTADSRRYYCVYSEILKNMIKGMTCAKLSGSISGDFIAQMIPHHQAAIEMSENILKYTNNRKLILIAKNIISEQTESIENMRKIYPKCLALINTKNDVCDYRRKTDVITNRMFREMTDAYRDDSINCDFLREMIPHHMGAVKMSENALSFDICPGLVPILKAIITSQIKGIKEMENLLGDLCCKGKGTL